MATNEQNQDNVGSSDESAIRSLYQELLNCWNRRSARDFAALFTDSGSSVGFDGSQMNGRAEVESSLEAIFAQHQTAAYIGIVREVRILGSGAGLLRAVAGMVPPGGSDINPDVNAVQSLVASKRDGAWRIELFHNTPAAFHGRPQESEKLTEELRGALQAQYSDVITTHAQ